MQGLFPQVLRVALIVLVPLVLVLSNVRLVLMPWFPNFEYGRAGFLPDAYGFTTAERKLHAARVLDYLMTAADIDLLGDQRFADGSPLYNARELRHMEDVKVVTQGVLWVWRLAIILALLAIVTLGSQPGSRPLLRAALIAGGAIAVAILVALLAYVLLNFNDFFTNFHRVFFESGTWMFSYADTLIRLFPLRFWSDVALLIGGGSLLEGLLLWWAAARFL